MASIQQPLSPEALPSPLSSRPERTRISCLAPLDKTACAPFFKERRILFASATNFYRKSGGAERRDLCVDAFSWKCFSTERREGSAVSLSSIAEAEEENCRSLPSLGMTKRRGLLKGKGCAAGRLEATENISNISRSRIPIRCANSGPMTETMPYPRRTLRAPRRRMRP